MKSKLTIGVIPAAGGGKRLGYLSHLLPKALFPVYDRPILHHVIDHMIDVGITDIYVIVNIFKEEIINYCRDIKFNNRTRLHFIEQKRLEGLASAILLAEKYVKNKPFMVILGDDCTVSTSLPSMIDYFFEIKTTAVEAVIKETNKSILQRTNSVKLRRDNQIIDIIEKPTYPKYLYRGCGIYLFKPEVFPVIRNTPVSDLRNEREITHTLKILTKINQVHGYLINGINININDYNDLLEASRQIKKHALASTLLDPE